MPLEKTDLIGPCKCDHPAIYHHWTGCGADGCSCKAQCPDPKKGNNILD